MKIVLIILCITLSAGSLFSQADVFYAKGKEHYDKDEHREALYYFRKFIHLDPSKAEVFKWRGNCYFQLNQLDSAQYDYETALRLKPSMHELYFNLSGVYRERNQLPEARRYMKTYLKLVPDDGDGWLRMASMLPDDASDSATYYYQKAYQVDPKNINAIMSLALQYNYQDEYTKSLEVAEKGWNENRFNPDLANIINDNHFGLGQFKQALAWSDTLIKLEPQSLSHYVTKARFQILLETDMNLVERNGYQFRFKNISNTHIADLDRQCSDTSSPYHYATLQEKFNQNKTLSLDQYFMLYYGYTQDSRYSPYGNTRVNLSDDFDRKDYDAIIKKCEEAIKRDPYSPSLYEALSIAQFRKGLKEEFMINLRKHLGIVESMLATGNGKSYQDAYIVTAPSHEYDLLNYLGLTSTQQSLHDHEGHSYDILRAKAEDETITDIHFNIDKPFGSLGSMLKSSEKSDKGKKKKKD